VTLGECESLAGLDELRCPAPLARTRSPFKDTLWSGSAALAHRRARRHRTGPILVSAAGTGPARAGGPRNGSGAGDGRV